MNLNPLFSVNRHEPFEDYGRIAIESRAITQVEFASNKLIAKYKTLPQSLNGRYINSDLFKELFPDYATSPMHRTLSNVPIHNSAAVLSNALFREQVKNNPNKKVLFLTGAPGSGKSTLVNASHDLLRDYQVIYEGQLSVYDQAKEKLCYCLEHSCKVTILALHRKPEKNLEHTLLRFSAMGRGASLAVISNIQGLLGPSLKKLYEEFANKINFYIFDLRDNHVRLTTGNDAISILSEEGNRETIYAKLRQTLETWYNEGKISNAAYRDALGRSPAVRATL